VGVKQPEREADQSLPLSAEVVKGKPSKNQHLAGSKLPAALLLLKVETCSSETSIDFQRTTQCYIPEDRTHLSLV
jgi:hypothetical protein